MLPYNATTMRVLVFTKLTGAHQTRTVPGAKHHLVFERHALHPFEDLLDL